MIWLECWGNGTTREKKFRDIAYATFLAIDKEELVKWHDKIFDLFLSCMETYKNLDNKADINDIKRGICS